MTEVKQPRRRQRAGQVLPGRGRTTDESVIAWKPPTDCCNLMVFAKAPPSPGPTAGECIRREAVNEADRHRSRVPQHQRHGRRRIEWPEARFVAPAPRAARSAD